MISVLKVMHYFRPMFPKTSQNVRLDRVEFLSAFQLPSQAALRNAEAKLELITDVDMLLMVEKCIRQIISHTIYRYAKANKK